MNEHNTAGECVLCGRCLEVCPLFNVTAREELSPRGKAFLLEHYHQFDIREKQAADLAGLCVGCRKCLRVCPQKLNLPLKIARLKSVHPDWKAWIWAKIIRSGPALLPAAKAIRPVIPANVPILKHSLETKPALPSLFRVSRDAQDKGGKAVIFPGCVGKHLRPGLEEKAALLLSMLGYQVLETQDWQCCGYFLNSAGLFDQGKKQTAANVQLWHDAGRPEIFTFCATCLAGLASPFEDLDEPPSIRSFRQSVRSLTVEIPKLDWAPVSSSLENAKLFWHEPCHGAGDSGQAFEKVIKGSGLDLTILNNKCCGMGGSFALQHPGLSADIAEDFWQSIERTKKNLVLTDCHGCVLQLESTRPEWATVAHWLEIITVC
jgi:glycolate oxidase iron-sulfur subunit